MTTWQNKDIKGGTRLSDLLRSPAGAYSIYLLLGNLRTASQNIQAYALRQGAKVSIRSHHAIANDHKTVKTFIEVTVMYRATLKLTRRRTKP